MVEDSPSNSEQFRRCAILFVQLHNESVVELRNIAAGGNGLREVEKWLAFAAHLDEAVVVETGELMVLQKISSVKSLSRIDLEDQHGDAVGRLISSGLLVSPNSDAPWAIRDQSVRKLAWWPLSAISVAHTRWTDVRIDTLREKKSSVSYKAIIDRFGAAPSQQPTRGSEGPNFPLCEIDPTQFDLLLAARKTCRNFDPAQALSFEHFSTMIARVWRAVGVHKVCDGLTVARKSSPAGGGLHATEVYFLVQNVEGLAPGIYHYLPYSNSLEQLMEACPGRISELAAVFVAGQSWFKDAAVLAIMTTRFERLLWKYRHHQKALRVASLDAGHLSQTMYLSAADLEIGCFISAAMNEVEIEKTLKLDPLVEAVTAIGGFGPRMNENGSFEPEFQ